MNSNSTSACPNCGETIPINDGYVTWCHKCHWNLSPSNISSPTNVFERLYFKLSRKYSDALLTQMKNSKELKPNFTLSMWGTYLLSLFVHSITLILVAIAIGLIIIGRHYIIILLIGIFLLSISYFLIPKPYKFNKKISCKNITPELFNEINQIAKILNAPPIDDLVITRNFNASYCQYGIMQKRVMEIGLPLFYILSNEEKVALISHELSHGINKDIQRNYVVHTALNALRHWYYFVTPNRSDDATGFLSILMTPVNILLFCLSKIILGIYYLIQSLSWYNSQIAEYLADYYATKACGSEAMISLLNKLCYNDTFYHTIKLCALNGRKNSVLKEFYNNSSSMPEREIDRIKLLEIHENSRLDVDHPPVLYRIEFIKNHFINKKGFILKDEIANIIAQEIDAIQPSIEKIIIDKFKEKYLY